MSPAITSAIRSRRSGLLVFSTKDNHLPPTSTIIIRLGEPFFGCLDVFLPTGDRKNLEAIRPAAHRRSTLPQFRPTSVRLFSPKIPCPPCSFSPNYRRSVVSNGVRDLHDRCTFPSPSHCTTRPFFTWRLVRDDQVQQHDWQKSLELPLLL